VTTGILGVPARATWGTIPLTKPMAEKPANVSSPVRTRQHRTYPTDVSGRCGTPTQRLLLSGCWMSQPMCVSDRVVAHSSLSPAATERGATLSRWYRASNLSESAFVLARAHQMRQEELQQTQQLSRMYPRAFERFVNTWKNRNEWRWVMARGDIATAPISRVTQDQNKPYGRCTRCRRAHKRQLQTGSPH
jgi:hypothetical protein